MQFLRSLIILLAATTIALFGSTSATSASEELQIGGAAVVGGTEGRGLRTRAGPGLNHRVLAVLPDGTSVQLLAGPIRDGQEDWYQVRSGSGTNGWSSQRYLLAATRGIVPVQVGMTSELEALSLPSAGRTFLAKITAYADGVAGIPQNARTASGTPTRAGVVAVDPRFIQLGSVMRIDGFEGDFVGEDVGSAIRGAMLDVWLADPAAARGFGIQYRTVTILREGRSPSR